LSASFGVLRRPSASFATTGAPRTSEAPRPASRAPDQGPGRREPDISDPWAHHARPARPRPASRASVTSARPANTRRARPTVAGGAFTGRFCTHRHENSGIGRVGGTGVARIDPVRHRSSSRAARPPRPRRPPQSFDSRSTHSWGQVCGHLPQRGGRSMSAQGCPPVVHRTRRTVPGSGDGHRRCSTAVPPVPPARTPVLHSAHRTYCHCCCFSLGEIQKTRVGERWPGRRCTGPECRTPLSGSTVTSTPTPPDGRPILEDTDEVPRGA